MSQGIVYIVDDDEQIRELLSEMVLSIGAEARCYVDAAEFLRGYRREQARECLLCDLRMPVMSGMQLHRHLAEAGATIPVIFMTGYADVEVAVEAMKRGAFDFIQKPFAAQAHLERIQEALDLSEQLFEQNRRESTIAARIACLTPQQRRVADLVVAGHSSPEIAAVLGLSRRTVENHRAQVMNRLHVRSTAELIRLLLDPDSETAPP